MHIDPTYIPVQGKSFKSFNEGLGSPLVIGEFLWKKPKDIPWWASAKSIRVARVLRKTTLGFKVLLGTRGRNVWRVKNDASKQGDPGV